mgnify:CR=1 FL=1
MSNIDDMYKDFFGLKKINEAQIETDIDNLDAVKQKAGPEDKIKVVKEADLVNKISDYRGGVVYKLHDPRTGADVKQDIAQFAAKKKMHIIRTQFNDAKGLGFFHFRLGEDPGKESQRIQGFISQLPEVKVFKFTIGQPKQEQ